MYSLTLFKSIFDNKTHKKISFDSWAKFEKLLYSLSKQTGYKPKKGEFRKGSPLISPASYKSDETRKNANVIQWNRWAALDVDEYNTTFEEALRVFEDYYFVCYSSASSTKTKPKFRIVLPLTDVVVSEKIRHFWYALNTEFKSLGDKQTKDLSRMYYVPAMYPNANNFIFTHKSKFLDPNKLMEKHEYVDGFRNNFIDSIPDHIRNEIEAHRKNQLTNTSIVWSNYHNCPFVNKTIIAEYRSISETGWYAKMYQIMVSIASNAIKSKYPITPEEISRLCKEIDLETGNWYKQRPMTMEASRAISYALSQ
jgi:hypothetical protein